MALLDRKNGKRVALVIGSGSVKCAAALGLCKVLQRHGIAIDMFVGCSGGSLFATFMALGEPLEDCIQKTLDLWNETITEKRDWLSMLRAVMPRLLRFDGRFGIISDEPMWARLKDTFGNKTFSDTLTPLRILATDLHNGDQVVLSEGLLIEAIRASICIPYIWKPWPRGDRMLVDGALANPMPVDVAIKERADFILAMGFESPYPRSIKSLSRFTFQVNAVMTNNLLKANFAFHSLAHHSEIIHVLPEFNRPITLFDTDQIPYVIQQGEVAMEAQIQYLKRLLGDVGKEETE